MKTSRRHPDSLRRSHLLPAVVAANAAVAMAGPGAIGRLARAGSVPTPSCSWRSRLGSLPEAQPRSDALLVPVVLATMHYAFGYGALWAMAADGVPLAAIARCAGVRGLAEALDGAPGATFAPSLS